MTAHVLLAGSERLTMSEADAIAKSFKKFGAVVTRHPIGHDLQWGEFVSDLQDATHLLLTLSADSDAEVTSNMVLAVQAGEHTHLRLGLLCADSKSLEQSVWMVDEQHLHFVVVRSPEDHSKVPMVAGLHSLLAENLITSSDEIAQRFIQDPFKHARAA
ncbi:MAG: hypothetical protein Q8R25_01785 [bacterium]|nr:hypothetical protein [bacterium]